MNKLWYLSQISMFEALPQEDFMEIDRMTSLLSNLRKGKLIQTPDTFREGLYFVKEGKLRLYKISSEGKQFTLAILGKGNAFGEVDSFSFGTRDVFIECIENTVLCSMGKEQFENFIASRPQLALKFLKVLSDWLKERDHLLEKLALGDLKERVLHLLLKLSEQFGLEGGGYRKIDLPLTHQEIANMIGATRESVTVILNELVKEGVIRTGRMSIEVRQDKAKEYV
jgi:CRP-like cAMP-binding protein